MKSAEQSLIDFLRSNPSKWASADLQRREFRNKNGTLASPRSLVRRLEENTCTQDNPKGVLDVSYDDHGNAWYQIKDEYRKRERKIVQCFTEDGRPYVKEVYV